MNPPPASPDASPSVTVTVPGHYARLEVIREAVLHTCRLAGLAPARTAQLEMAVDEACSNIIEHSYGGENAAVRRAGDEGIRLRLVREPGRVVVEIFDRGDGFDFDQAPVVSPADYFEERRQRGLGMYIIRCFVDAVSYQRATPQGNCLRLTKLV